MVSVSPGSGAGWTWAQTRRLDSDPSGWMSNAGEPGGECLGDDQCPVVGDHRAVGKPEILRGHGGGAIGVDAHEAGRRRGPAAHQVEAGVPTKARS